MRSSSVETVILSTLSQEKTHLTSHQVYVRIRKQLPAVNPSTVYRALERLVSRGEVSVADIGSGAVVYESLSNGPHHHLVCQRCGEVIELNAGLVDELFTAVRHTQQFEVITNHLILFGVCPGCQTKEETITG